MNRYKILLKYPPLLVAFNICGITKITKFKNQLNTTFP